MLRLCPRFSLRTLAIFITLVCVYFGAWEATEEYGIDGWETHTVQVDGEAIEITIYPGYIDSSPGPFVIYREWDRWSVGTYYLWFFGLELELFDTHRGFFGQRWHLHA